MIQNDDFIPRELGFYVRFAVSCPRRPLVRKRPENRRFATRPIAAVGDRRALPKAAVPSGILRRILREVDEGTSVEDLRQAQWLDMLAWQIEY